MRDTELTCIPVRRKKDEWQGREARGEIINTLKKIERRQDTHVPAMMGINEVHGRQTTSPFLQAF
jgi:hypothetical protein